MPCEMNCISWKEAT